MQVPRTNRPSVKMADAVAHLEGLGVSTEGIRGRSKTRKRGRSLGPAGGDEEEVGEDGKRVRAYYQSVVVCQGQQLPRSMLALP